MESIIDDVTKLGFYIATVISDLVLHALIVLPLAYFIFTRKNLFNFILGLKAALLNVFGTNSRAWTTLPNQKPTSEHLIDKREYLKATQMTYMADLKHPRNRSASHATGVSNEGSSSWILRDQDNKLQVCDLKLLQDLGIVGREFINFVTILGPARQGKSFLMNSLMGEEVFGTADTMDVCTKGVVVGNVFQPVGEKSCVVFVDTEGQGDEDVDSDVALLTPVLLLSKVILFNWKGGLQKNRILNDLAILVEVGNCVSSHKEGITKFGHLHIVMRDFHFQGSHEDASKMIFGLEEKRGQKVRERNEIRQKLLSTFESIDISILPAPCDTTKEVINDLKFLKTTKDFQKEVQDLKRKILMQTKEQRSFENIVIHAGNAQFFIDKFVEELQKGDIVHSASIVSQFQKSLVNNARRVFEKGLLKAYKEIDLPVAVGIEKRLEKSKDKLLKNFNEQTAKADLETTYRDDVFEMLLEFADREMETKRRENLLVIQRKENEEKKQLKKSANTFTTIFEKELTQENRGEGDIEMAGRLNNLLHEVVTNFEKSTKSLDWISKDVSEDLTRLTNWASSRVSEKVKAKRKEHELRKKALAVAQLTKAVDKFRDAVESWFQSNRRESSQRFLQGFQVELENCLQEFQRNTSGLTKIPEQTRNLEREKLLKWAMNGMAVKAKVLEDAEQEKMRVDQDMQRMREQESMFQSQAHEAQQHPVSSQTNFGNLFMSPSSSPSSMFSNPPSPFFPSPSPGSLNLYRGGQFTPGGGRAPAGGCYMSPSSCPSSMSSNPSSPLFPSPSPGSLNLYRGGQFTPGGGRAPAGGCYMSPSSSPSSMSSNPPSPFFPSPSPGSLNLYRGGQFTPGGGRAPAGGCYMSPSSSGKKFYKGGQFTPGGGRAPKGGCWR